MDQVHVLRHKVLVEGRSRRSVAHELGISRNTVRRYLGDAPPIGERKPVERSRPVFERVGPRMDELLEASREWTHGKQRLTARRLHAMLVEEGHEVGYTLVREHFKEWRRRQREVFVPLVYQPGDLAQVDFFEVYVVINAIKTKAFMFLMRFMSSKRDFAWLYPRQDQVCFLDGHVRAFAHIGVPRRVEYDNLKAAVRRMCAGTRRELSERFDRLSTTYAFEPCFARPYTGHDKGGVEARGKGIRWQHLVPIPQGESLDEISAGLLKRLDDKTEAAAFDEEKRHLRAPPLVPFDARKTEVRMATRSSTVRVEGATYSVPSTWTGLDVLVRIGPGEVEVTAKHSDVVVVHPRLRCNQRSIDYRHYLPELAKKPQAVRQVAPVLTQQLGPAYVSLWARLVDELGPLDAARRFAKVIGAVLNEGFETTTTRVQRALAQSGPIVSSLLEPQLEQPVVVHVPETLRVDVETAKAADFDELCALEVWS